MNTKKNFNVEEKYKEEIITSKEVEYMMQQKIYTGKEKWLNISYVKDIIRILSSQKSKRGTE